MNQKLRKPYISNTAKYYADIDAGYFHKAAKIQDLTTMIKESLTKPNIKQFRLNYIFQSFSVFCQIYIHIFRNLNLFIADSFEQVNSLTNENYNYFDHEYVCSNSNKRIHIRQVCIIT